jgi:hypothetical protein
LLKNVMGAIAILSQISMAFYTCFALWTVSIGGSAFAEMRWIKHVPWWEWGGLSTCVPIVSAALTAQTQFFLIYQNTPNNSISEMRSCVLWACFIVRVALPPAVVLPWVYYSMCFLTSSWRAKLCLCCGNYRCA